jgi:hypothetical protein
VLAKLDLHDVGRSGGLSWQGEEMALVGQLPAEVLSRRRRQRPAVLGVLAEHPDDGGLPAGGLAA